MTDPDQIRKRITEAQTILAALGLPTAQQNTKCSLVLLALLDLPPDSPWTSAANPLRGIHAMREFCIAEYGQGWAVNTRESVRKTALHYFEAAGIVVTNPDDPNRSPNSKDFAYQVPDELLRTLRSFSSNRWDKLVGCHVANTGTLVDRFALRRTIASVPLELMAGSTLTLAQGPHGALIEQIVLEFGRRFTPGGRLIYTGDTGKKWGYFDQAALQHLHVNLPAKGTKMPDVIIHHTAKNWLVLVEAFYSGGSIDPLRKLQLETLFAGSIAPLVFVTAFRERSAMARQASKLAWETDIWIAEAPDHLIHYNGERFLGPYD